MVERYVSIRFTVEEYQKTRQALEGLGEVGEAALQQIDNAFAGKSTQQIERLRNAMEKLAADTDPAYKALQRVKEGYQLVNEAQARGEPISQRTKVALQSVVADYERQTVAGKEAARAAKEHAQAMDQLASDLGKLAPPLSANERAFRDLQNGYQTFQKAIQAGMTTTSANVAELARLRKAYEDTTPAALAAAAAADKKKKAEEESAKATARAAQELSNITAAVDPVERSYQRLTAAQENLAKLDAAGIPVSDRQRRIVADLSKSHEELAKKFDNTGRASRITAQELRLLTPQLNDIFTSVSTGMPLFIVAAQQLPQIAQIFGGYTETLKRIPPAFYAIGAAAVATLAVLTVSESTQRSYLGLQTSLRTTRDDYAALADQITQTAKTVSENSELTKAQSKQISLTFVGTRDFDQVKMSLTEMNDLTARFSRQMGVEAPDAAKTLARAITEPTNYAKELNRQNVRGFNDGLIQAVKNAESLGQNGKAAKLIYDQLNVVLVKGDEGRTALQKSLKDLGDAFDRVGNSASNLAENLGPSVLGHLASFFDTIAKGIDNIQTKEGWMKFFGLFSGDAPTIMNSLGIDPKTGQRVTTPSTIGTTQTGTNTPTGYPGTRDNPLTVTSPSIERVFQDLRPALENASNKTGVPLEVLSRFQLNEGVRNKDGSWKDSPVGAVGPMQVMPATYSELAKRYNISGGINDPQANVLAGAYMIKELLDKYQIDPSTGKQRSAQNQIYLAAAGYNAGPERLRQYLEEGRDLPKETVAYANKIVNGQDNGSQALGSLAERQVQAARDMQLQADKLVEVQNKIQASREALLDPNLSDNQRTILTKRIQDLSAEEVKLEDIYAQQNRQQELAAKLASIREQGARKVAEAEQQVREQGRTSGKDATPEGRQEIEDQVQKARANAQKQLENEYAQTIYDTNKAFTERARVNAQAAGAARDLAEAETAVREAARQAGREVDPGDIAVARAQKQAELNVRFDDTVKQLDRNAASEAKLAQAYKTNSATVVEAENFQKAYNEALAYAIEGTPDFTKKVNELAAAYNRVSASNADKATAKDIINQNREIETIERTIDLQGTSQKQREIELAGLQARNQLLAQQRDPNTELSKEFIANAKAIAVANQELTRQQTAYSELENVGTQAFERIGSAITESLAQGEKSTVKFSNIVKASLSELLQYVLKMGALNPLKNWAFGQNNPTLSDTGSALSKMIGGGSDSILSSSYWTKAYDSASGIGKLFGAGGGYQTGITQVDKVLNYNIVDTGTAGEKAFAAAAGIRSPGLSVGQAGGAALGLAGGAYGIYQGAQTGGAKGLAQGVGGAAGVAGGAATLATGLGAGGAALAAVGTVAPYAAVAALIASYFLPGQKPSNKEGNALYDTTTGAIQVGGQTGKKYSQENRDIATNVARQIGSLTQTLGTALGLNGPVPGQFKVGFGNRDGAYAQIGTEFRRYTADEAGAKALVDETVLRLIQNPAVLSSLSGDARQVVNASGNDLSKLTENLDWYNSVYKPMKETGQEVPTFTKNLDALKKTFSDITAKARELGLGTEELDAKLNDSIAKMFEERNKTLDSLTAGYNLRYMQATMGDNARAVGDYQLRQFDNNAKTERDELDASLRDMDVRGEDAAGKVSELIRTLTAEREKLVATIEANVKAEIEARERAERERQVSVNNFFSNLTSRYQSAMGDTLGSQLTTFDAQAKADLASFQSNFEDLGIWTSDYERTYTMLVQAQSAERLKIIEDYNKQLLEAEHTRFNNLYAFDTDWMKRQIAAGGDTVGAGLFEFDRNSQLTLRDLPATLAEMGVTGQEAVERIQRAEQVLAKERSDLLTELTNQANRERTDATNNIISTLDSLKTYASTLRYGDDSALTSRQKYEASAADFQNALNGLDSNDYSSVKELSNTISTFLQQSKDVNGTGVLYYNDFTRALEALNKVSQTSPEELITSAINYSAQQTATTINSKLDELKEVMQAILRENQQSNRSLSR